MFVYGWIYAHNLFRFIRKTILFVSRKISWVVFVCLKHVLVQSTMFLFCVNMILNVGKNKDFAALISSPDGNGWDLDMFVARAAS